MINYNILQKNYLFQFQDFKSLFLIQFAHNFLKILYIKVKHVKDLLTLKTLLK